MLIGNIVKIKIKNLNNFQVKENIYSYDTTNAILETIPIIKKYKNKFFYSSELNKTCFGKVKNCDLFSRCEDCNLYLIEIDKEINKYGNNRFYLDESWIEKNN